MTARPRLAVSQGDPAGIGPELLLKLAADPPPDAGYLFVAERSALAAVRGLAPAGWDRLRFVAADEPVGDDGIAVIDPVGNTRDVVPGRSGAADAAGAMAALDRGISLARSGRVDALVTLPVSKESIARHGWPGFRGHTDYLAEACGLSRYGRDYLMAFLAPRLRVALLTVHVALREALDAVTGEAVGEALDCLARHVRGRIAVAALDPHAGEGGLLGTVDRDVIAPAVASARARGVEAVGPESADSLFARARGGEFDWVLALYHDQGLIAVKTAAFGEATNWTLGLPFLRTSVDHGTAFGIAGTGRADDRPLRAVIAETVNLVGAGC